MARLGLVCVVLWAVFVQHALSVDAKTYTTDWICVGDLKKPRPGTYWGSTIVQRSMEKIFVWYEEATRLDRPGPVSKALFVFPVAYETAQPRLRRLAAGRFGEVKAVETKAASFLQDYLETLDDSDRVLKKFARKKQEKERKNLGLHGIKVDGFRQIKLSSADYNEGWTPGGSSELTLWILDGADVLGVVSTLAIVSRVDYGRIFGRFPHTRIPGFWSVKPKVVTVTEYALMATLASELGVPFMVRATGYPMPIRNPESLIAAKRWLQSQNTASPEPGAPLDIGRCPDAPIFQMNRRGSESAE